LELRADLGPARDRFFNAQVGQPGLRASRTPHGEERGAAISGLPEIGTINAQVG
jgi:hypothetical protein